MKEFLVRLTNVIHWIAFLVAILITIGMLLESTTTPTRFPGWDWYINYLLPTSLLLLGGWALKYVLTGRMGFFPWMTK